MENRLLELVTDRKGKLSPFKLAWQLTAYSMLSIVIYTSFKTGSLVNLPENWIPFLITVGGASLGRSYLANKQPTNPPAP